MRKEHDLQKSSFFGDFSVHSADTHVALQVDDLLPVLLPAICCFLFYSCATLHLECKFLGAETGIIFVHKVSRIPTELYKQLKYYPINHKTKISSCHNAKICFLIVNKKVKLLQELS